MDTIAAKMKHSSKKGLKQKDHNRVVSCSVSGIAGSSSGIFKGKESRLSKAPETPEECSLSFPDLRIVDNNKLPCYLSSEYLLLTLSVMLLLLFSQMRYSLIIYL